MSSRILIQQKISIAVPTIMLPALLLLVLACGGHGGGPAVSGILIPDHTATSLSGRFFTDHQVLLLPGTGWRHYRRMGSWVVESVSTLTCCVFEPLKEPLTVVLRTRGEERRSGVDVLWDGVLHEQLDKTDPIRVVIDPSKLTPGVHRIKIVRNSGAAAGGSDEPVAVAGLGVLLGHEQVHKGLEDLGRLARLNRLVESGVMPGQDPNGLHGGFAFYGPAEVTCDLPSTSRLTFTATLANHSNSEASFRMGANGAEAVTLMAPGQEKRVTVHIPSGEGPLLLAVEGEERGLFYWGEPWLESERKVEATPVILITLDTTRRDAVSPTPGRDELTPVLAGLCREATVFSRAHAVAPWTLPAHASIFTGLYPSRHGAGVAGINLDGRFDTLAEHLLHRGYFTAGFAGGFLASSQRGLAQGFCRFRDPGRLPLSGDILTDHALTCLEDAGHRPLFIFLNYFDPHAPYDAPEAFRRAQGADRLRDGLKVFPWWREIMAGGTFNVGVLEDRAGQLPSDVPRAVEAAYLAEVAFMDFQLGRLFEGLRRHGLYQRALIVVCADHGEFLGEGGRYGHSCRLDPELTEIPLIIKWPGQRRGRTVEDPVSQVDLYSTILEAVGISSPPGDGKPLPQQGPWKGGDRLPIVLEEHLHPVVHDFSRSPKRLADHLYATVGPLEKVTVWEGGQEAHRWRGTRWQAVRGTVGWEDSLASVRSRLTPILSSPARGEGHLDEEEVRQLRMLGYLEDESQP